jgi:hypothetical protein
MLKATPLAKINGRFTIKQAVVGFPQAEVRKKYALFPLSGSKKRQLTRTLSAF